MLVIHFVYGKEQRAPCTHSKVDRSDFGGDMAALSCTPFLLEFEVYNSSVKLQTQSQNKTGEFDCTVEVV